MGYIFKRGSAITDQLTPITVPTEPGPVSLTLTPGTYLQSIVILPVVGDSIRVGTTPGGNELEDLFPLTGGDYNTIVVERKFLLATTIYITGLSDTATITLYKR